MDHPEDLLHSRLIRTCFQKQVKVKIYFNRNAVGTSRNPGPSAAGIAEKELSFPCTACLCPLSPQTAHRQLSSCPGRDCNFPGLLGNT